MPNSQTRRPQAREDLLDIWHYIADDNETAATAFLRRIDRAIQMLADNPQAGRDRSELAPDLRSFPVGNYVIFYSPASHGIDVVRVLNVRQDISAEDMD
jgi:toxin ParE1/3/4